MNDYEQMRDDNINQNTHTDESPAAAADTHAPSGFHTVPNTEGHQYTNPDGSHGFVYNDPAAETRTRRYRGALIAVSVMLVTVLAIGACFVGAWMAARSLHPSLDGEDTTPSPEVGTSEGLYIESETDKKVVETAVTVGEITPPENATIVKKNPLRTDGNGDGKADAAYDVNGHVLTSAGANALPIATVFAKVSASVVEITTETLVQSGFISQYVTAGAGSGVVIAGEGYIVTNHHVVDGANTITVRMSDGTEFSASVVGSDEETDIAVLWINAGNYPLTVATIGASYDLVVGEDVLAIGNPLGSLGGTLTEGIISATARDIQVNNTDMTLLQISAPINPGNSGGGLFNLAGELVGIVNAKMSSEEVEGLGFAIPSDTAYAVVCELINYGYVRGRPALGVTLTEVRDVWGEQYVRVNGSDHALLQNQDLILKADGVSISSVDDLSAVIQDKAVGESIVLTVYRNKQQIELTVPIIERKPAD